MGTSMTGNSDRGHRLGRKLAATAAAAAVSLVVASGCTVATGEGDPVATQTTQATESIPTATQRADRYLAPYANAADGAKRKVGSDWYERTDGRWVEMNGAGTDR